MGFSWQQIGIETVRIIISVSFSLVLAALVFRKYMAPEIAGALEEAQKTIKTLASLGGIKKADLQDSKKIETLVAEDFIKTQIPELELVKKFVSPGTWEEIEETIQENPAAIIQLWDKYGHYFTSGETSSSEEYDFA